MFCTNCGNEIPTGGRFCVTCGCPVETFPLTPIPPADTTETTIPNFNEVAHETQTDNSNELITETNNINHDVTEMKDSNSFETVQSKPLSEDEIFSQVSNALEKEAIQTQISEELSDDEMFSQVSDALAKQNFGVLSDTQFPNNDTVDSTIPITPNNNPYAPNTQTYQNNAQMPVNTPYTPNMQGYQNNAQMPANNPYTPNTQGYQNSIPTPNNIPYQQNFENQPPQNSQPAKEKKKISVLLPIVALFIFAIGAILFINKDILFSTKEQPSKQTSNATNTDTGNKDAANIKNNNQEDTDVIPEETEVVTEQPKPTKTPKPTKDPMGIHSYKVKKGDVTWKEAKSAADGKHSHLATANSEKEWKAILKVAKKAQKTKGINVFWIGAKRNQYEDTYYWQDSIGSDLSNNPHWMDSEPSYYDSSVDKNEYYVELMYIKSSDSWVLNDAPNNITAWYSGKIGYIVENED